METDRLKVLPEHFFRQKRTRSPLKWSKKESVGNACRPFIKPERADWKEEKWESRCWYYFLPMLPDVLIYKGEG